MIGQLISHAAPFGNRDNETTSSQACQVVRQDLAGYAEAVGQLSRVARVATEPKQDPCSGVVRECVTEAGQGVDVGQRRHARNSTAESVSMDPCLREVANSVVRQGLCGVRFVRLAVQSQRGAGSSAVRVRATEAANAPTRVGVAIFLTTQLVPYCEFVVATVNWRKY